MWNFLCLDVDKLGTIVEEAKIELDELKLKRNKNILEIEDLKKEIDQIETTMANQNQLEGIDLEAANLPRENLLHKLERKLKDSEDREEALLNRESRVKVVYEKKEKLYSANGDKCKIARKNFIKNIKELSLLGEKVATQGKTLKDLNAELADENHSAWYKIFFYLVSSLGYFLNSLYGSQRQLALAKELAKTNLKPSSDDIRDWEVYEARQEANNLRVDNAKTEMTLSFLGLAAFSFGYTILILIVMKDLREKLANYRRKYEDYYNQVNKCLDGFLGKSWEMIELLLNEGDIVRENLSFSDRLSFYNRLFSFASLRERAGEEMLEKERGVIIDKLNRENPNEEALLCIGTLKDRNLIERLVEKWAITTSKKLVEIEKALNEIKDGEGRQSYIDEIKESKQKYEIISEIENVSILKSYNDLGNNVSSMTRYVAKA